MQAICDRVIIIHKGKIVGDNTLQQLQAQHQNAKQIIVQYKENITKEMLEQLPGITYISQKADGAWIMQGDNMEALQNTVLTHALDNHLNIISLQQNTNSLEDVFKYLTN